MTRGLRVRVVRRVGLVVVSALVAAVSVVAPAVPAAADGNEAPGNPLAFRSITAGDSHTCALLDNGTVKCWGYNSSGQLGLGDTAHRGDGPNEMGDNLPAVNLGAGRTATAVTAGGNHTCALLDDGTVKCWGNNTLGQLGLGDTAFRGDGPNEMGDNLPAVNLGTGRTATAVTAGQSHTCALLDNATLKCWGLNEDGELGLGDRARRGDNLGEMGDLLPAVNLGTGRTATAVTAGYSATCALLDNGTVKCWGENNAGQLGLGDTASRGDQINEMGDLLPAVSLGTGRTAAAVTEGVYGPNTTCVLLDNATVKCWGYNFSGALGLGDTAERGDAPNEMGDLLPAVNLGTGRTATAVTTGGGHTCALLDNATLKCWGDTGVGQLGEGQHTNNRGDQANEMGDNRPAVNLGTGRTPVAVTTGRAHTCALLDNGSLKCWGNNPLGQLGLGDTAARGYEPGEMGDNLPAVLLADTGVSGTVTEAGSGSPVAGAFVAVLRTSDFSTAGGVVADGSGNYSAGVAPGSYYLYLVDPAGTHIAGFFGPPTTVTVPANHMVDADPSMSPTRGAVAGTVTDQATAAPIAGAFAVTLGGTTGIPEIGATANGAGQFTVPGLRPGTHFVGYIDPTGGHKTEFYPHSPNVPDATPVAVTAGGTTTANGSLPTQALWPGGAALTGTVTEAGTATPLAGVYVLALRAADYQLVRAATTNASGAYNLNVQAGGYKLEFVDSTGTHNMEWHNNQPPNGIGAAATVTAPAVTNAALDPNTGTMAGTIVDDPAATPLAGAWALAIGPAGIAAGAVTAANGTYTLGGLPPGTYRATFVDPNGGRTQEYFDNSPTYPGATTINITAAATTTINAALHHP